jgi:3-mercaptopyruvate sulfurtransferase SseA
MKKTLLVFLLFVFALSACNAATLQTESAQAYPNQAYQNQPPTQTPTSLPLTEADVPRLTAQEAKVAYDSGQAVIVDVRSDDAYALGHIAGAYSIPLADFENSINSIQLDKDQWIITYCT